jgi:hypothetical protein
MSDAIELGYDPNGSGKLIPKGKSSKKMLTRAEWEALPTVAITNMVNRHDRDAKTYQVWKVGIYDSPDGPLPIASIESATGPIEHRLPVEFVPWVEHCIGMAMMGANAFPAQVEFAKLNGEYHVRMK